MKLIRQFEGYEAKAYKDNNGWAIGYGRSSYSGFEIKKGDRITKKQAEKYLKEDIATTSKYIDKLNLAINDNQKAALIDFVHNIGIDQFRKSDLLVAIKSNDSGQIKKEFRRWVWVYCNKHKKKEKSNWQINRREAEIKLYFE